MSAGQRQGQKGPREKYIRLVLRENLISLMFMFNVLKGDLDIRMVYDGSRSGLNEALWSPWFLLPTIEDMTRSLMPGSWCADNDYGDCFLNFPLHLELQKYCGIDVTKLFPELQGKLNKAYAMWERNAMGLKPSPYNLVKGTLIIKRITLGNWKDVNNVFSWDVVKLNLPGTPTYNPTEPWISKRRLDGSIAAELSQYVDDLCSNANTKSKSWDASSKIAKTISFLGAQDAARKWHEPSQEPGAWAGVVVATTGNAVRKYVTQERWDKAREKIRWLGFYACIWHEKSGTDLALEQDYNIKSVPRGNIPHKIVEKHQGFLVYVARTYKAMNPFLKGLHLTLDFWRPHRDQEGWKNATVANDSISRPRITPPKFVKLAGRFRSDITVLLQMFFELNPPRVLIQPSTSQVFYLVGDASGFGFGLIGWNPTSTYLNTREGIWNKQVTKNSSNYREAYNHLLGLEAGIADGSIQEGTKVFVFTDNYVSKRAYEKGLARSKDLHDLVTKFYLLQMKGVIFVHFIWIAGTQMIEQGADGLSRGNNSSGVLSGDSFLEHIPLATSAFERHPFLLSWLQETLGSDWIVLSKEGWFDDAFHSECGKFLWAPPPAVADAVISQLCECVHIHSKTSHCFVCPALMTARWQKQLRKLSAMVLTVKVGSNIWPTSMHEPLVLAFISPLFATPPFTMRRTRWVAENKFELQDLLQSNIETGRCRLRKFWDIASGDRNNLSERLARALLPAVGR